MGIIKENLTSEEAVLLHCGLPLAGTDGKDVHSD